MKSVGMYCARGRVSHEDCQRCMLEPLHPCGLPPELLELMRHHDDEEPDNLTHSPSRLLGCNRKAILMSSEPYYLNVEHEYAALRGTLIHNGIENIGRHPLPVLKEQRIVTMVDTKYGPQEFSAKADCVVVVSDKTVRKKRTVHVKVRDYKTKGEIGHDFVAPEREHVMQVNMYAWVVQRNAATLFGPNTEVVVDELEINYLGSNKPRRFTSAGPLQALGKKPRNGEQEYLTLESITLLPMERVERFIRARIERRIAERNAGLPPVLEGDDAKWCFRCPVQQACIIAAKKEEAAA